MVHNRMLWAVLSIVVGALQAWDSGILQAGSTAAVLVAIGVLVPSIALAATPNWTAWVASLVAGAALLAAGRMSSAVPLNAVHIGLFVPAIYVLFVHRLEERVHASNPKPGA